MVIREIVLLIAIPNLSKSKSIERANTVIVIGFQIHSYGLLSQSSSKNNKLQNAKAY